MNPSLQVLFSFLEVSLPVYFIVLTIGAYLYPTGPLFRILLCSVFVPSSVLLWAAIIAATSFLLQHAEPLAIPTTVILLFSGAMLTIALYSLAQITGEVALLRIAGVDI